MPYYEHHVFICTNRRDPHHSRGSCANKNSETICKFFKRTLEEQGLSIRMRANSSGCLNQCEQGPCVVVYPEQVWYTVFSEADVVRIVEEHLKGGRPVEELKMKEGFPPTSCL